MAKGTKIVVPEIPNKLYFRIGEVSDIVSVKPYVLRYWESEFPDIKPSKSKSGQRLYKRRDVELLLRIKQLLYEERFTINGARKRLKEWGRAELQDVGLEKPAEVKVPKQLDVFSAKEGRVGDPQKRVGGRIQQRGGMPRESMKTLHKVRRDLEELLEVVRG
jgi:DNA-binding transcriptional MerR regulator